jgi:hypothetical protein
MTPDAVTFISIAASLVGSVAGVVLVGVGAHAYWQRVRAAVDAPARPDADRLARLEAAVDAIAVEIERIGEGQRFLARLDAESRDPRTPDAPRRVSDGASSMIQLPP